MEAHATVFVVDDDPSFRTALMRLLRSAGHSVMGFDCAERFLEVQERDAAGCLVLDLAMPGLDGLALQDALAEKGSDLPIVFLTGRGTVPASVRAMKRGAEDFLAKPVDESALLESVAAALKKDAVRRREDVELRAFRDRWDTLTAREREVVRHVISGRLNKQIARELGTVERTVKLHRGHAMAKLDLHSVAELARLADRTGIEPL